MSVHGMRSGRPAGIGFLLATIVTFHGAGPAHAQDGDQRAGLREVQQVSVIVASFDFDGERYGLNEDTIRAEIVGRLIQSGIPVGDRSGRCPADEAVLHISVMAVSDSAGPRLAYFANVAVVRRCLFPSLFNDIMKTVIVDAEWPDDSTAGLDSVTLPPDVVRDLLTYNVAAKETRAATWERGALGITGVKEFGRSVREGIVAIVDYFIQDFLAVREDSG